MNSTRHSPTLTPSRAIASIFVGLLAMTGSLRAEDALKPKEAMKVVLEIRKTKGDEAAIQHLTQHLREVSQSNRHYYGHFTYVWREAQVRTGRLDQLWASKLNDVAFTVSLEERRYYEAFSIVGNLASSLNGSGRYGRCAEVLAIWEEAQKIGGNPMDLSQQPDLGPAIPCLPEIRHRDSPATAPYAKKLPEGIQARSRPGRLYAADAAAYSTFAGLKHSAGRWQESLEWMVWLRDLATDDNTGQPTQNYATTWYGSTTDIAAILSRMGFYEESLAMINEGLAAPLGDTYHGRYLITLGARRLNMLRALDRAPDDIIRQLEEFVARAKKNQLLNKNSHWNIQTALAKALIHVGQVKEGEQLFNELVEEGSLYARECRIHHWLDAGQFDHFEEEILILLKKTRENGHKIAECDLYGIYGRFLEATGRHQEALQIYREALRLSRSFNLFYRLPVDLARLAKLLHHLGDNEGAAALANEARGLLADGRIAPSLVKTTNELLASLKEGAGKVDEEKDRAIDLQPERSTVVPIAKTPWSTYLTLTNPSNQAKLGRLKAEGLPVILKQDADSEDVIATLCQAGQVPVHQLDLSVAPGSYRLIWLQGTSDDKPKASELHFTWTSLSDSTSDKAMVALEPSIEGITSGIIQAGAYRNNPFYGVPVHHHYVDADGAQASPPLRFVCSQPARVEIYLIDGTPLGVDAQGNGSHLDVGDQLFARSDGDGHLLLPLSEGAAGFQLRVYPAGPLPKDGLKIDIQAFENGAWESFAENRLTP